MNTSLYYQLEKLLNLLKCTYCYGTEKERIGNRNTVCRCNNGLKFSKSAVNKIMTQMMYLVNFTGITPYQNIQGILSIYKCKKCSGNKRMKNEKFIKGYHECFSCMMGYKFDSSMIQSIIVIAEQSKHD